MAPGGSDFLVCPMGIPASEELKPKIGWCFYTVDLKPTPTFPNNVSNLLYIPDILRNCSAELTDGKTPIAGERRVSTESYLT